MNPILLAGLLTAHAQTSPPLPLVEARAGGDFMAYPGQTVELAGSSAGGGEEVSFAWVRRSGPPAELDDPSSATPRFTPQEPGSYVWELTATSGGEASLPDEVTVVIVRTDTSEMTPSSCSVAAGSRLAGGAWGLLGALALLRRRRRR